MCLSLGSWIRNWRELYRYCYDNSDVLILETNNIEEGQKQVEFVEGLYSSVVRISDASLDDRTGNDRRQLWLCSK